MSSLNLILCDDVFSQAQRFLLRDKKQQFIHLIQSNKELFLHYNKLSHSLLNIAIESNQIWAIKEILNTGVNILESPHTSKIHLLPLIYVIILNEDPRSIFQLLINHAYIDCNDMKTCFPILLSLLLNERFGNFELFLHATSISISDFFATKYYETFPFSIICFYGKFDTAKYLLDNYSMNQLNIKCKEINNASQPSTHLILECNDLIIWKKPLLKNKSTKLFITHPEQEVPWAIQDNVHYTDNNRYSLLQRLLHMGYLDSKALCYSNNNYKFIILYLAHKTKILKDIRKISYILEKDFPDVHEISYRYALKVDNLPFLKDTLLTNPDLIFQTKYCKSYDYKSNIQYYITPLSTILRNPSADEIFFILKNIYFTGYVNTNHLYSLDYDSTNLHDVFTKKGNRFRNKCLQSPLYRLISRSYVNNNFGYPYADLINILFAAGEQFDTSTIKPHRCNHHAMIQKKGKIGICQFRGPGKENWLLPMCEDLCSRLEYVPSLFEIGRHKIRKRIQSLHPHCNLYKTIPKLCLPSLMINGLLFNTIEDKIYINDYASFLKDKNKN